MPEKYIPSPVEKPQIEESERRLEIKRELIHSLDTIRQAGLFDDAFLDELTLVIFGEKRNYRFQNGEIADVPKNQFDDQDFMQGKRIDFTGINPKDEFEEYMKEALKKKHVLELIFLNGPLIYDEFVAHEIAHNIFDRQYVQRFGEYKQKEGITDVSDDYREKIKQVIIPLIKQHYPQAEVERFEFSRQQIAEVFAMLYEREFCRRSNINLEVHEAVERNVFNFFDNPEKMLAEFNGRNGSSHTIETLHVENHSLSIIVAPLLEKDYPEWEDRINIFWK
jgi:hypothetical protein